MINTATTATVTTVTTVTITTVTGTTVTINKHSKVNNKRKEKPQYVFLIYTDNMFW